MKSPLYSGRDDPIEKKRKPAADFAFLKEKNLSLKASLLYSDPTGPNEPPGAIWGCASAIAHLEMSIPDGKEFNRKSILFDHPSHTRFHLEIENQNTGMQWA
jgi:hypothetical protein